MRADSRLLAAGILALWGLSATVPRAAAPDDEQEAGAGSAEASSASAARLLAAGVRLSLAEVEALRQAILAAPSAPTADDPEAAVLDELRRDPRGLDAAALARVAAQLRGDPRTLRAERDLLAQRLLWSTSRAVHLVFWWDPRQRAADGAPSRGPTPEETALLDRIVVDAAALAGVEPPRDAPYRIDLDASAARVLPRDDLRFGVVTPAVVDPIATAKLGLQGADGPPALVEPLAWMLGRCGDSRQCRRALLEDARRTVGRSGYVPLLESLRAGNVVPPDDPAFASVMLAVDHLQRVHPPSVIGELLRKLGPKTSTEAARRIVAELAHESPAALDRAVLRDLRDWQHGR